MIMQSLCCGSHHNGEVTRLSLHHKERIFPAVLVLFSAFLFVSGVTKLPSEKFDALRLFLCTE